VPKSGKKGTRERESRSRRIEASLPTWRENQIATRVPYIPMLREDNVKVVSSTLRSSR
jgi:hypothetical protein